MLSTCRMGNFTISAILPEFAALLSDGGCFFKSLQKLVSFKISREGWRSRYLQIPTPIVIIIFT